MRWPCNREGQPPARSTTANQPPPSSSISAPIDRLTRSLLILSSAESVRYAQGVITGIGSPSILSGLSNISAGVTPSRSHICLRRPGATAFVPFSYRSARHNAANLRFGDGDEHRTPMGCRLVLDPGDRIVLLSAKQAKKYP